MSNPFFRYPKFWTEALNVLPLLAFCLYALSFSETAGVEAAVIRVFVIYGLFLTYPTKKLVFSENPRRKRWFAVLYTPHLLFGVWLSYWGCTHGRPSRHSVQPACALFVFQAVIRPERR